MNTVPSYLTDAQLLDEVRRLARSERTATTDLVAHLAELESRGLHLAAGFSSLFAYCREVLGLPEDATCNRTTAVRMVRTFPVVLPMLADGRLHLSTLRLLSPRLTVDNHSALLQEAARLSKREVEELIARWFPQPDVATSIRKAPERGAMATPATPLAIERGQAKSGRIDDQGLHEQRAEQPVVLSDRPAPQATAPLPSVPPLRRPVIEPLAANRYLIKFTASAAMLEKLQQAQNLLRHAVPSGDAAQIFDRALTALVEDLMKKKFAATDRPRASRGTPDGSRDVPAAVKRAVWMRDDGQCSFAGHGGRRCEERGFLEFHHLTPYAAGGQASVENVALRCRVHNQYESDLFFAPIRADMSVHHSIRPGAD